MNVELPQPDRERLSALTALILLAYGLVRIVALPTLFAEFEVFGLLLRLELNTQIVMLSISAGLAIAGAEWLLQSHPSIDLRQRTIEHWIIPGLAAVGIGALIIRVPAGPALGVGLVLAAGLLISVLVAEFIVLFAADPRRDAAAIGLRILAYLLLVESIFALKATGMRAAFAVPLILIASAGVSWRLLRLGRVRRGAWIYALVVGWLTAQIGWNHFTAALAPSGPLTRS